MAISYQTIPISDLTDISNIPIADEPADSIDFTKQTETPATTTIPQTRYDLRSRQGPRSRIASTNLSVNNPNNNRESPRPLRIATSAAPSSDSQEPTRPHKRPRTRTRTRTCSSGSGSGSGGVQVHDVTTLRDITGRNTDFNSCSSCNQWYAMVYRKVVAQMIDVLEEREVERFLCVQDVYEEDAKDVDVVMMVYS
ncbi:uncharacterized protein STEHIDRAFT_167679 [Stereum hirsutum FP-91666 SS1]|uniref:uncharacterized protein n=1 Tax=Stereum hirsutum (strain FP-91666) TaxID=721885 RepID=UPI000440D6DB|nr:uncharacterized protein STEHIDRAFT_167679 [Stereum hirsutum FP-91666 SS1]EIM88374.1 hypothetical protein STEHIDRAFT_167679 [Stereum hirsutum FP-91666 SS1]